MNDAAVCYQGEQGIRAKGDRGFFRAGSEACSGTAMARQETLSGSRVEWAPTRWMLAGWVAGDSVPKSLQLEKLRNAVAALDTQGQKPVRLRHGNELSMEECGETFGVSKMAVSKQLKKLHQKLHQKLRTPVV